MSTKAEHATKLHENGCNCAQAVACSFCQEFGIDENEMFRIAEGFGLGMGVMEMCGALSGMAMIIGLSNSRGNTEEGSGSKGDTYKKLRTYIQKFKEKNGSCICRELKGRDRQGSLQLPAVYHRCGCSYRRISCGKQIIS